jgi:hypothetical protein
VHLDTKKLGKIAASGTASLAAAPAWSTVTSALAGNTCTSPSMMPRA